MIFCEECRTWQHVDCCYPNGFEPAIHCCSEACAEQYIERTRATQRQKSQSTQLSLAGTTEIATDDQAQDLLNSSHTTDQHTALDSDDEPIFNKRLKVSNTPRLATPETTTAKNARRRPAAGYESVIEPDPANIVDLTSDTETEYQVNVKREEAETKLSLDDLNPIVPPSTNHAIASGPPTLTSTTPATTRSSKYVQPVSMGTAATAPPPAAPTTFPPPASSININTSTTTFIFFDIDGQETRRRPFNRCNTTGKLFGHATAARTILPPLDGATLTIQVRGTGRQLVVVKGDEQDFETMMQMVQQYGVCIVDIKAME